MGKRFKMGYADQKTYETHMGVTISDLAIFNFLLRYDVASEVSPTWLTPVYLLFVQVAVT